MMDVDQQDLYDFIENNNVNPLYDSDTHAHDWCYTSDEYEWLRAQAIDPDITYRYEIYVIDGVKVARVYQYVKVNGVNQLRGCCGTHLRVTVTHVLINSWPPGMADITPWMPEGWPTYQVTEPGIGDRGTKIT